MLFMFFVCSSCNLVVFFFFFFFFNDTATTEIYTLSLHDALPSSAALAKGPSTSVLRSMPELSTALPLSIVRYRPMASKLSKPKPAPSSIAWQPAQDGASNARSYRSRLVSPGICGGRGGRFGGGGGIS